MTGDTNLPVELRFDGALLGDPTAALFAGELLFDETTADLQPCSLSAALLEIGGETNLFMKLRFGGALPGNPTLGLFLGGLIFD